MISVIVLAGGQSRRMGSNKALLDVEGKPLIQRVVERVQEIADEVIVVTNTPETYAFLGQRMVADQFVGAGALAGLHAGLVAATHALAIAVACDMPFLNTALLRYMLDLADGYDVVMPVLGGQAEPLHACYAPATCVPAIVERIQAGDRRLISFLAQVRVCTLAETEIERFDPQYRSFHNLNTPQEWQDAQRLLHPPQ